MDGAVESGQRSAQEVYTALGGGTLPAVAQAAAASGAAGLPATRGSSTGAMEASAAAVAGAVALARRGSRGR
jgi:hypothetical protein